MTVFKLTRRRMLIGAAGAVAVAGASGLWLGVRKLSNERFHNSVDRGDAFAPSVYLAVQPDGEVVIWLTRSEMGQGVSTALPMLVADELDADWSRIRVEQAVAGDGYDYGQLFTAASASVRGNWIELRRAGASAREMLISAAADQWGVSESACSTESGFVLHGDSGRRLGYGSLASAAAQKWPSIRPRLKDPSEFRLIGQPVPRRDVPDKVTGTCEYGADVVLDGMLRAVIARSPVFGGRVTQFDDRGARNVTGVQDVVEISNGVAVVADNTYAAMRGREALTVQWDAPSAHRLSGDALAARLRDALDAPGAVARDDGTPPQGAERRVVSADYELPFLAHVCMEPMNCTVWVEAERCRVWVPTQAPHGARRVAAEVTGLPLDRVAVHTTNLGGGFGRRTGQDFVREAVELADRIRRPVQVMWSREDDLAHGEYREATAHRLRAELDQDGRPLAWLHRIASAAGVDHQAGSASPIGTMGAADLPYHLDAVRVEWTGVAQPLPLRIWRSVGHSYNAFAVESFIDEIAVATDTDPLTLRLNLLQNQPRLANCLRQVADAAQWQTAPDTGRFLGIAAGICMDSYVAQVAEVTVDEDSGPRLSRIWCAADCGVVVNPDITRAQIEGAILYGLDALLAGGIDLQDGQVVGRNFDRHRTLRIDQTPDIHVTLIGGGSAPSGVGEIGVPFVAPALANAWFRATGRRVRNLWGPWGEGAGQG